MVAMPLVVVVLVVTMKVMVVVVMVVIMVAMPKVEVSGVKMCDNKGISILLLLYQRQS